MHRAIECWKLALLKKLREWERNEQIDDFQGQHNAKQFLLDSKTKKQKKKRQTFESVLFSLFVCNH